jgi:hypothetical protein
MEGVSLCGAPFPSFYPFTVSAQRKNEDIELIWRRKFTRIRDYVFFFYKKILLVERVGNHVSTVRIFNLRIFRMLFLLSKNGLCMWISAYPLVEIDDFLKVPHLLWVWAFVDMYLTHLWTRIQRGTLNIYLRKWFFWTSKDCCTSWAGEKKLFLQLWMLWSRKW